MESLKRLYRKVNKLTTLTLAMLTLLVAAIIFGWFFLSDEFLHTQPSESLNQPATTSTNAFLTEEEVIILDINSSSSTKIVLPIVPVLFEYVEVVDGCDVHFEGECLRVRSGPGLDFPVVARLRNHMVLKVGGEVDHDGLIWYKIVFNEWLRYPERITSDWYVSSNYVDILYDEGDKTVWDKSSTTATTTNKKIVIDRSEQKLYAYKGAELIMEILISTGLELTPTPRGTFAIFKKTPSRYMQGPIPGLSDQQAYDMPGVPWNLYFTHGGAVIHGAYWHNSFGIPYSHGCVNLSPWDAEQLYYWAELGTKVVVQE
jgi:hypothetical protein